MNRSAEQGTEITIIYLFLNDADLRFCLLAQSIKYTLGDLWGFFLMNDTRISVCFGYKIVVRVPDYSKEDENFDF